MKVTTSCYDYDILRDILSRLPLKSLMRFKCVCRPWQSLIEGDQWLIDLHHSRTPPRLLIFLFPRNGWYPVKLESYWTASLCTATIKDRILTDTVQGAISNKDLFACEQVLKPINGMICLVDKIDILHDPDGEVKQDHAACLYSVITREATPWIRSTYLAQVEEQVDLSQVRVYRTYEFGFDPTTKDYKLICMWRISGRSLQKFEGCGEYTSEGSGWPYRMCEILTLGKDTAWRRIDNIPLYKCADGGSVYANGSIYWTSYENPPAKLVAFDVGREKYRVISVHDLIDLGESRFMELDGKLAIEKRTDDHVDLWKLDVENWTKEIITLPPWLISYENIRFHVIAGTDYLILDCYYGSMLSHHHHVPVFVYSYNRKHKTFSKIKLTGDASPFSTFGARHDHPLYMFTTYAESLLTFQRSCSPATDSSSAKSASRLSDDA